MKTKRPMKRIFELHVHADSLLKIRMTATSFPGETAYSFQHRATMLADCVGLALVEHYGASKVDFIKG